MKAWRPKTLADGVALCGRPFQKQIARLWTRVATEGHPYSCLRADLYTFEAKLIYGRESDDEKTISFIVRGRRLAVVENDLTITGEVAAQLFAATTGSYADFIVKLIDVYPENAQANAWEAEARSNQVSTRVL